MRQSYCVLQVGWRCFLLLWSGDQITCDYFNCLWCRFMCWGTLNVQSCAVGVCTDNITCVLHLRAASFLFKYLMGKTGTGELSA